ncbi:MAG: hypothetical protein EHM90_03635 [Chloroflexi bacterium]|nr:MAG: hypothetical protein EHM90_03635 [Chloroflexota bacterium]
MRPPVARRRVRRLVTPVAVAATLALLMTACVSGDGGGGGGGNGDAEYVLRVLMINAHTEAHTLSYSGGPPLPDSVDGETAESCTAIIVSYAVTVPFEILVDGVPVMISDELPEGVPQDGETDLVAVIDVLEDGTAQASQNQSSGGALEPGRQVGKPATQGICP